MMGDVVTEGENREGDVVTEGEDREGRRCH